MISIVHGMSLALGVAPLAQLRAIYSSDPSMFETAGRPAGQIASLGWILFWAGLAVFLIVMMLLIWPMWRSRHAKSDNLPPAPVNERAWVLVGGTAIPAVILTAVFVLTLVVVRNTSEHAEPAVTIEVIGHQWWWEVRYPDLDITTADEIHIPVGVPVRLVLTSADVLHSFWLPNIAGKTDLITGTTNYAFIEASMRGVWRGQCAEYCGLQHAHMALSVVAEPEAEYQKWVAIQRAPAGDPIELAAQEGARVFHSHPCQYCHQVRGTTANSHVGPDLTHIASRLTLPAGHDQYARQSRRVDRKPGKSEAWGEDAGGAADGAGTACARRLPRKPQVGRNLGDDTRTNSDT